MEHSGIPREPDRVLAALLGIGEAVRVARMRRRMSTRDFAGRVGISLPTLRKLERGEPGVSWGIVLTSLWVLGLLDPVWDSVRPERDVLAAALDVSRLAKRIRNPKDVDLADL